MRNITAKSVEGKKSRKTQYSAEPGMIHKFMYIIDVDSGS